ncbi:hypothetical protein N0V82_010100 [Gnomoniopsis sp. IMI 355080]|nr:hypothetical protein N0V82_010100 [Gnomoniopsis sp. IMI 355080]
MPGVRLPKSPIKTTVVHHDEHSKDKELRVALDPECSICQVQIGKKSPDGVKEGYAVTPCGHVFGRVCIKTYLAITEKPQCPICRTDLFHHCSHPVQPALYDHKKSRLPPSESAAKAFPDQVRSVDCKYCRNRKLELMKRLRRREILEAARASSGASSSSSSGSGGSSADGSGEGEAESSGESPSHGTKVTRWALHTIYVTVALAKLTLDAAGIRKIKMHPHGDQESATSSSDGSEIEDYDEEVEDADNIMPDSPISPLGGSRNGLPPVPGPYGHWDLAKKDRDWKFLSWYNEQEPKINPPREHYS